MDTYEKKYKEAMKACKELSDAFDNETLTEELEKIFPELRESEDKRIKNILYCIIRDNEGVRNMLETNSLTVDKALNWLEKQGEQKPAEVRTTGYRHVEDTEQNSAWSEEDEKILDGVITNYESGYLPSVEKRDEIIEKLKSLKERIQPQSKQEWNYNDEIIIGTIIQEIEKIPSEKFIDNAKYRCLDWLRYRTKSLRPQNRWKPSDEQMHSLKQAINAFPYETDYLELLYEQLKKL